MARLIRKTEVRAKTGLSDSTIRRLELANEFPARVKLGPNSAAWIEKEVDAWIETKASVRGGQIERKNGKEN